MTQVNLNKALEIIADLEKQAPAEIQAKVNELKLTLQNAVKQGEGADAEAARSQLDALRQETGQFTSVMVHEIRKPMTAMRGWVDMLSKNMLGELNPMQTEAAKTIRNNVISMDFLVTDISDLSKMRTGRLNVQPKMEMVKNITMKLEKDLAPEAEAKNMKLIFDIPSGLPFLNIDGTRVELALRKMIENSLKYGKESEGEIVVTAAPEGTNKVRITVKDNGIGMSEEDQKRLGEMFFRGDHEMVTQTKGYGMGIPIALECMKLIGGEVFWESKLGEGSTFGVIVPAMS